MANSGTFGVVVYTFDNSDPNIPTVAEVTGQAIGGTFYYFTFPNDADEDYTFVITTNAAETVTQRVAYTFS